MLSATPRTADTYYKLYEGKTVVVKVDGKALADPTAFETVTSTVKSFGGKGVSVVLVYDGEEQIDKEWNKKHPGQPRPKKDGVGITTKEIMTDAVLPAARDLAHQMHTAFAYFSSVDKRPDPTFVKPSELVSQITQSPDIPEEFSAELVKITADLRHRELQAVEPTLHIIGFVGEDPEAARVEKYHHANLDPDGAVAHIARNYGDLVDEVLFVTGSGGVQDNDRKIVPLLTKHGLDQILQETHLDEEMLERLKKVRAMLENIDKVAITNAEGLRKEIEYWKGGGTLCINEDKATFSQASKDELAIFETVYADYVMKGTFRARTAKELDLLKQHHHVLRVGNSPLAGLSLMPVDDEWSEISAVAVWGSYMGNGIGAILGQKMCELARTSGKKVYALSNTLDGQNFFKRAEFTCHGPITGVQAQPPFSLPEALEKYAVTEGREQPVLFTNIS